MDDDDADINSLIQEWQALQIRAESLVRQLEAAQARRGGVLPDGVRSNRTATEPIALGVAGGHFGNGPTINGITRGDRVRIRNRVYKPATWPADRHWDKEQAKLATVTRVTSEQIHFVTDNGIRTWRAPNNLERILS